MAARNRDRGVRFAIANRTFDLDQGCHYGATARRFGQHTTPIPLLAAGLLVSLAPVLIVFLLSQRTLARGLTAGAVK